MWIHFVYPPVILMNLFAAYLAVSSGKPYWFSLLLAVVAGMSYQVVIKLKRDELVPKSLRDTLTHSVWTEEDGTRVQVLAVKPDNKHLLIKFIKIYSHDIPSGSMVTMDISWRIFNKRYRPLV